MNKLEFRSGVLGAEDKVPNQASEIRAVSATVYRLEITSGAKDSVEENTPDPSKMRRGSSG